VKLFLVGSRVLNNPAVKAAITTLPIMGRKIFKKDADRLIPIFMNSASLKRLFHAKSSIGMAT
jgi:hypothetical protein